MKYFTGLFFCICSLCSHANDSTSINNNYKWGISVTGNYSFSGLGVTPVFELIRTNNIFYLGPKFITNRNYLPNKGPWGINIGYRHEFRNYRSKRLSFFFFSDYQLLSAKAFSHAIETKKRNYYHEFFAGYGLQVRLCKNLFIGNAIGVGVHMEVFNNVDLDWKQRFLGYNNLVRIYANYRF